MLARTLGLSDSDGKRKTQNFLKPEYRNSDSCHTQSSLDSTLLSFYMCRGVSFLPRVAQNRLCFSQLNDVIFLKKHSPWLEISTEVLIPHLQATLPRHDLGQIQGGSRGTGEKQIVGTGHGSMLSYSRAKLFPRALPWEIVLLSSCLQRLIL